MRGDGDADRSPGVAQRRGRLRTMTTRSRARRIRKRRKVAARRKPRPHSVIPNVPRAIPGVSAERMRESIKCVVGDPAVQMHPAVVTPQMDVVAHVRDLRIATAQRGVVVRIARRAQRAQPHRGDVLGEQLRPDQPIRLIHGLTGGMLLHERPEHVGERLGQRSRLAPVNEVPLAMQHAVRELVTRDVDRRRVAGDHDPVAVTVHHLRAVPERIVVLIAIMNRTNEVHPAPVDGVTSKHVVPKRMHAPAASNARFVSASSHGGCPSTRISTPGTVADHAQLKTCRTSGCGPPTRPPAGAGGNGAGRPRSVRPTMRARRALSRTRTSG